jgi:hypothetical protein
MKTLDQIYRCDENYNIGDHIGDRQSDVELEEGIAIRCQIYLRYCPCCRDRVILKDLSYRKRKRPNSDEDEKNN